MKGNQQQFVPNKKLILHFDVDGVLRLPSRKNKDLYVSNSWFRFTTYVRDGCGVNWRRIANKIPTK